MVSCLRLASSFSPASWTFRCTEVERGELFEVGEFLQPRIRHLHKIEVECGELFEVGKFLQPGCIRDSLVPMRLSVVSCVRLAAVPSATHPA